jgi:PAS domain S-box-containing protein
MLDAPSAFNFHVILFLAVLGIGALAAVLFRLRHQARKACLQAKQRQADAENRFALAFHRNADPLCICQWDGRILEVNRMFGELFGYRPEELIGRNMLTLNLWQTSDERTRVLALLGQRAQVNNEEVTFRNRSGAVVPTLLSMSTITFDGQTCLLTSLRDLSVLKTMEKANRKLEHHLSQARNLEAMATLVGGIAHRFNNMLTSIIGHSELALDDIDAGSAVARDLERILVKATEARQLVEQLLAFSQGRVQDKQRIDLFSLMENLADTVRNECPEHLRVATRFAGEAAWILADPASLQLALRNISRNAMQAMPGGGTVILGMQYPCGTGERFADTDVGLPAGDYAHVFIKDQGEGMDPSTLDRIFNPFFTTKQLGQGTGMGLAMVHGIVQDHQGIIRVNSRKGYGSTFHLFFPVVDGATNGRAA